MQSFFVTHKIKPDGKKVYVICEEKYNEDGPLNGFVEIKEFDVREDVIKYHTELVEAIDG